MAGIVTLLGQNNVINQKGEVVDIEQICKDKAVGIYFSAHWCPPCRGFTPVLTEFYKANSDKFECIFVSSDRDEASFKDYFGEMPWHALDFKYSDKKSELSTKFGIQGIPALVILNQNGDFITKDGRGDVSKNKSPTEWLNKGSATQQKSM